MPLETMGGRPRTPRQGRRRRKTRSPQIGLGLHRPDSERTFDLPGGDLESFGTVSPTISERLSVTWEEAIKIAS